MNRFLILILTAFCLVSCKEKDNLGGGGTNPLNDVVISENALPGGEAVVQWNGFGTSPELCLVDEHGMEYPVEVSVVTASGLIFRVPQGLAGGVYKLILNPGQGTRELGSIELLMPALPVTGLIVPDAVEPGKDFLLEGIGFTDQMEVLLGDLPLQGDAVPGGLQVSVPAEIASGVYTFSLTDGVDTWMLSGELWVTSRKSLTSISMLTPTYADYSKRDTYKVESADGVVQAIVFTSEQLKGTAVESVDVEDRYVLGTDGVFRAENGESTSNNLDFGYNYSSTGRILSADVRRFSQSNPDGVMRTFLYEYNADGSPSRITYEHSGTTRSMQMWFYDDGNITEMKAPTIFVYDDESLKNNPFSQDFSMAYAALSDIMEPFVYAPYLLGKHPFASRLLPSAIKVNNGYSVSEMDIVYTFDDQGYMIKAEVKGSSPAVLTFSYS